MRSIKMSSLALVAVIAFGAVGATNSSAKEPVFWRGSPATELTGTLLITIAQKTTSASENFLESTMAGTKVRITCEEANGDGTAENSGGVGVVSNLTLTYTKCKVVEPNVAGCEVKSPGAPGGTIKFEAGITEKAVWAASTGEAALTLLTGKGAKEEFAILQFTSACKLPVSEVNLKGQWAAKALPAEAMSEIGELEFPTIKIAEYFTGSPPGTKHTIKTLEIEAVGGLVKGAAIIRTTDFLLQGPGLLPPLGLLSSGTMGTR